MSQFVLEHYRALGERFTSQGNRLWTRFHYFLTIEVALIGVCLTKTVFWPPIAIACLGLFWTTLWFIVAAQDLWFYENAMRRLRDFKSQFIVTELDCWDEEKDRYEKLPRWKKLICFKLKHTGVTTFASICPLLFAMLWILWVLITIAG